uniref:Uridine phosphorylase 2 n=1 Tax=Cyclopterus lumpus TaxID=8103 RepID=A0A8C2ZBJ8_CYCLU
NVSVLSSTDPSTPSGVKPGYQGINGQISQIPGLSPTISTLPEERARGRRAGVLASDSDYIKLAKQGGHKGLLWHEESITSKLGLYKPPDWFCATSEDNGKPSLINNEEMKNPGAFQAAEAPFGTDNMSAWGRDDSDSNGKEKVNKEMSKSLRKLFSHKYQNIFILSLVMFDKNPAPVDMSKLLSFGYGNKLDYSNKIKE